MPSTAWSSGASSNTMLAALPPSSRVSALSVPATPLAICLPTSVEPVNATLSTPGWRDEVHPDLAGPRDDVDDARRQVRLAADLGEEEGADRGVVEAGLRTTVLPAARAGAIFQASISSGKFHGMTWRGDAERPRDAARERVLELVRPAGVVPEVGGRERHVDVARLLDRLARVHRSRGRRTRGSAPGGSARSGTGTSPARGPAGCPTTGGRPGAPRATALSMSAAVALATCGERLLGRRVDVGERRAAASPGPRGRR